MRKRERLNQATNEPPLTFDSETKPTQRERKREKDYELEDEREEWQKFEKWFKLSVAFA